MSYEKYLTLETPQGVSPAAVKDAIDEIWPEVCRSGGPADGLPKEAPFHVGRDEAQFDAATTILISVSAGLAKDAITAAWKTFIWPHLQQRFGLSEDGET